MPRVMAPLVLQMLIQHSTYWFMIEPNKRDIVDLNNAVQVSLNVSLPRTSTI